VGFAADYSYIDSPDYGTDYGYDSMVYPAEDPSADAWTDMTFDDYSQMQDEAVADMGRGWTLLAEGNSNEALDAFAQSMIDYPADALPQIGFALSAAILGRHDEAARNMRAAMALDAESLFEVPHSDTLATNVAELLAHYQSVKSTDGRFMTAVLQALRGEHGAAYFSIDTAIDRGDADAGAAALKRLLQVTMDQPAETAPTTAPAEPAPEAAPML
jgi:tetratricopeptide (TPR) repeat protein